MIKELFDSKVGNELTELFEITKYLYDNPEIGMQEYKASKVLVDYLKKNGFKTQLPYVLETGFLGVYESTKPGPKIAFLCEYDALPEVGHGCGHNLICTMSLAAAVALRDEIDNLGGSIYVFGTPAEENFGGKVKMAQEGAFDEMDVALMLHPSCENGLGSKSCALIPLKCDFYGVSAHACNPYNGVSALDAAVSTFQGINMLRQFSRQPSFIHGIIKDGGTAANVIPEHASLEYYFRAETIEYCKELEAKAKEIAKGAAMMFGCKVEFSTYEEIYEDTKINYTLAEGLKEAYECVGLTNVLKVKEELGGSTDVGSVSKVIPTIQGNIKIVESTINGHSKGFAEATISNSGRSAIYNGGIALALTAHKYLTEKEFREKVWKEFKGE